MTSTHRKDAAPAEQGKAVTSLICGALAGIMDMAITYPTEYIKTQMQLPARRPRQPAPSGPAAHALSTIRTPQPQLHAAVGALKYNTAAPALGPAAVAKVTPMSILVNTIKVKGPQALWTGVWPAIYGNALKAGVRFMFYDNLKAAFSGGAVAQAGMGATLAAGFLAGAGEALIVLQPLEGIRTKLIDDSNARVPRFRGSFMRAAVIIPREEGIRGIYRGWAPCAVRQGSSTAVRFGAYEVQKRWWRRTTGEDAGGAARFAMGGIAGATTVYTTMPLDVLKTKMQSLSSHRYAGSFDCLKQTIRDDGMKGLWKGATPRLGRLIISGGITFGTYEWLWSMVNPAVLTFLG